MPSEGYTPKGHTGKLPTVKDPGPADIHPDVRVCLLCGSQMMPDGSGDRCSGHTLRLTRATRDRIQLHATRGEYLGDIKCVSSVAADFIEAFLRRLVRETNHE